MNQATDGRCVLRLRAVVAGVMLGGAGLLAGGAHQGWQGVVHGGYCLLLPAAKRQTAAAQIRNAQDTAVQTILNSVLP